MRKRTVLLLSLFTIYASIAFAEPLPQPSRAGLALQVVPIEALAPAVHAAPDALEALETYNLAGNVPTQNGFSRPLINAREVRLSGSDLLRPTPFSLAGGVLTRSPHGDLVWSGEVRAAGAHALRLHLSSVTLPAGTRAWVYAPDGEAARVPLSLFRGQSEVWTGPVWGESLWLEVAIPASALSPGREARFTLDRVLELVRLDDRGRPVTGPGVVEKGDNECFASVPCAEEEFPDPVGRIKEAVARIFFVKDGGGFICSGGLLEDSEPNTDRPLFLTANHCIPDAQVAATVVSFFRLWNTSCGSMEASVPDRVDGATLLSTYEPADGTLIELAGLPPDPQFLPYDASPAAGSNGVVVNDVSLPGGFLQVFSRHRIVPQCINNENFYSTETLFGGVGGGSSGSLAVNDAGRVIGTLRGICGTGGEGGICVNPQVYAFFGRLSTLFENGLKPFLDPPDAGFFQSTQFPDFAFRVKITAGGDSRFGRQEPECISETECVSGAIPGRAEVFLRIVGPRPNGKLWPTIVKFTTSRVEVRVRQLSTGIEKEYILEGAAPGIDELPGLFDRGGFDP
ncbi:MAG TPA: hypothetical protein VLF66_07060 [Thermoanaerobaculia bacterium]|nr:hypothetical protein [Thermoanaerobaculia bacterium]